jgi:hypothetical protein
MTTDPLVDTDVQRTTDPASREARVQLTPGRVVTGYVDGGWWPRSTDPAVEFPALITALTSILGPISRVRYNLDAWTTTPCKLTVGNQVVRMDGFRTMMQPDTVTLTAHNRQRISLLVLPPHTPEGVAHAVLKSAANPDTTATVQDILTSNGCT